MDYLSKSKLIILYTISLILYSHYLLMAQPIMPIKLITQPDSYKAAFSVIGASSMVNDELSMRDISGTGEVTADLWLDPFLLSVRYNTVSTNRLIPKDSLTASNFAFSNPSYLFNFYGAFRKPIGKKNSYASLFFNSSVSRINTEYNDTTKFRFDAIKLELGYHMDFVINEGSQLTSEDERGGNGMGQRFNEEPAADVQNPIALSLAFKINHIQIQNPPNKKEALSLVFAEDREIARKYWGWGVKVMLHINHLSFYFETHRNFRTPLANKPYVHLPGYVDRSFFNFGVVITGSALEFVKKPMLPKLSKPTETSVLEKTAKSDNTDYEKNLF